MQHHYSWRRRRKRLVAAEEKKAAIAKVIELASMRKMRARCHLPRWCGCWYGRAGKGSREEKSGG
jgi:hypothetical protein